MCEACSRYDQPGDPQEVIVGSSFRSHLTVHSLRHTLTMNLYQETGDLWLVQSALGHRHIGTTEICAGFEDKALRRAIERL